MSVTSQINDWIEQTFKPTLEKALDETKIDILHEKQAQFVNHGANDWDSSEWPEVSKGRRQEKVELGVGDPDQSLVFRGTLHDSLYMSDDPYNFKIEIEGAVAQDHAEVSEAWLRAKGSSHFIQTLSPIEREKAIDDLALHLKQELSDATN